MRRTQLLATFVLAGTLALAGCATAPVDPTAGMTIQQIYAAAKEQMSTGQWDQAITFLDKLEIRAAGTVMAQQAELDKAYANYKNDGQALAISGLNRFIKLHPANSAIDYALYLKGLVSFHDDMGFLSGFTRQSLAERDQQALKDSFVAFKELITRFPNSRYSADARARMVFIHNTLAQSDVFVADYYFQRGAYVAAINRAQLTLTEYGNSPATSKALYIMYESYGKLGLNKLQEDSKKIFELNYPKLNYKQDPEPPELKPWWQVW
jgi:outer membrane protein assembly factor BamD